jgi:hypothetical protein
VRQPTTLFCFVVARPLASDYLLLPLHSLSQCDDSAVFSNVSFAVLQRTSVAAIRGSMDVGPSAYRGFALNVPIFLQVWKHLAARALLHSWIVKLDVDTVLFVPRLRRVLQAAEPHSSLLTNPCSAAPACLPGVPCSRSPHAGCSYGGLMVFSAVFAREYAQRGQRCRQFLGPYDGVISEDGYMHNCVDVLNGSYQAMPGLLSLHQRDCCSGDAAYHPRKAVAAYSRCQDEARRCKRLPAGPRPFPQVLPHKSRARPRVRH